MSLSRSGGNENSKRIYEEIFARILSQFIETYLQDTYEELQKSLREIRAKRGLKEILRKFRVN